MATHFGRTSLVLASGTMISRALGFVKAIVLAQTIGLVGSASADAFANANSLPTNIYGLIAGGLLNAVLVPQIVRATKSADGGQVYVNRLITLAMVILGGVTLVITVGAPVVATIYGLTLSDEALGLVIAFAYWCLPQVFFYALYAVISEVLNARKMFIPFAWAPVLNNVIAIGGLIVFGQVFGRDPNGVRTIDSWDPLTIGALGGLTTLGVVAQALVLFLFLPKVGLSYRPDFRFRGTGLGRIGSLASWSLGMVVIVQVTGWTEILALNLAFGEGVSLAAIQNANLIFLLPHAIITVSLTTMMFTSLSERAAENKTEAVLRDFSRGTRLITMFMVFATVGLIVMSPPFARIFSSEPASVDALAGVLSAMLLGLVGFSLFYFSNRVNFAYEDTRSVFLIYAITAPIHIGVVFLVATTLEVQFIAAGIAFMGAVMTMVRLGVQLWLIRRRLGSIDGRRIVASTLRFLAAAVPTALAGFLVVSQMGGYEGDGWARRSLLFAVITCAVSGIVMTGVYFTSVALLRSPEFASFFAPVLRRFHTDPGRHSTDAHRHAAHTAGAEERAKEHGTLFHFDDHTVDFAASVASTTGSGGLDGEIASMASHTTSRIPSREELLEYARQREQERERAAYLRRVEDDDEPLI